MDSLIEKWPQHAAVFAEMGALLEKKLWHELTVNVEAFYAKEDVRAQGQLLVQVYEAVLRPLEDRLQPFRLAKLAVQASEQIDDPENAIEFLNGASKRVEQTRATGWQQAVLLLRLSMAGMQVHQGQHAAAKNIIQESKNEIESMQDPLPELQAAFYLASCDSLKANRQFSQYYKNALTYLAYVDLKTMPNEDKTMFAVDLVLAALLGEDTYTFGELLRHPLVEGLRQGPHQWLHALLESVDGGDLVGFEAVTNQHADYFNAQPLLVENKPKIEQKVSLLALVNRIIAASAVNSEFTFDSLAKSSKVPLARIEILVMKAISLHLISGHMDEVKQTLTVTWVMPKQLTDKEVKQRGESVENWSKHIYNVLLDMENEVPELLLEA